MNDVIKKIKKALGESFKKDSKGGILLSGGLDSAIIAALRPKLHAITVSLESYGEDARYAAIVQRHLKMKRTERKVTIEEAIEAIPTVIRILRSFDPAIPNDLAVYFGLKKAKEMGISSVATGDAGDELFGGYSFMEGIKDLNGYIRQIARSMYFSSNEIGNFFDIIIEQPFMEKAIIDLTLEIPSEYKIREEGGRVWGKWILRHAFQDLLPQEILWQSKRPLEQGSGMSKLRDILTDEISDEEFNDNPYPVKFMNKEHFYYYKVYLAEVGKILTPVTGEKPCPGCGAGMKLDAFHCKVCGNVLTREHAGSAA